MQSLMTYHEAYYSEDMSSAFAATTHHEAKYSPQVCRDFTISDEARIVTHSYLVA